MSAPEIGTIVRLRGLTLKGKNRIARGGTAWEVRAQDKWGFLLVSVQVGVRECFWARLPNDPNVETA